MPFTILQVVKDLKFIYLRGRHFLEFYYWGPKWLYMNTGKFTQHVFQRLHYLKQMAYIYECPQWHIHNFPLNLLTGLTKFRKQNPSVQ